MHLERLLKSVKTIQIHGSTTVAVGSIAYDSRQAKASSLFVSLHGAKTDGQLFVNEAIQRGATTIVSEQPAPADLPNSVTYLQVTNARQALSQLAHHFYGQPSDSLKVVGITGTNGKTTSSYLLEAIFQADQKACGLIGTIQYRYPGTTIEATRTTPEASDLYALMSQMRGQDVTHLAMEVSSHALELCRVHDVAFDVGLITNITQDHLDFHGDMPSYIRAKAKLLALLSESKKAATAVINGDEANCGILIEAVRKQGRLRLLTFGWSQRCDIRVHGVQFRHDGLIAQVGDATLQQTHEVRAQLVGRHNLANILGAIGAARALDIPWSSIQKGVTALKNVPGRLQCLATDHGVTLYVDYAHTDDALKNVLQAMQAIRSDSQGGRGRIITVFGCGGDRDRLKRPRMGEAAMRLSDRVIVTSDNPRSEEPEQIIREICAAPNLNSGLVSVSHFLQQQQNRSPLATTVADRREAIQVALECAEDGDLILIAGKGHEDYQEVRGVKHPFSDVQVSQQAIGKLGWKIVSA